MSVSLHCRDSCGTIVYWKSR